MKKVLLVFGTRPEAIKLVPVVRACAESDGLVARVCVTGQHREMLDQVLQCFDIQPEVDLNMMRPGQDLTDITSTALLKLRDVFKNEQPDCVVVQGDTTTAMATALAAFYARVPVVHIEAGLRTGDLHSPWPEEVNRRVVTLTTWLHFCPTDAAAENLLTEGVPKQRIQVTGNTVIDALLEVSQRIERDDDVQTQLNTQFDFLNPERRTILVTGHRRENFGQGMDSICEAISVLSRRGDVQIVYPVHLNPNVQEPVKRILQDCQNVTLLDPLDYVPFVYLMNRSHLILTDSGGVQEEAPSLGKPVLVMRDTTERPEGITAGTVRLIGTDRDAIVAETERLLDDEAAHSAMSKAANPYGDGQAAGRIAQRLAQELGA